MEALTMTNLSATAYVFIALAGILVTLDKAVDVIKKWKAPATSTVQKLANDKVRLDNHEAAIKELKESGKFQSAALVALLDHELHNGNTKQMEAARDDLLKHYMNK